ncbi:MAG: YDG domain-containing protein, partial [Vicinamibacterales bacterium]
MRVSATSGEVTVYGFTARGASIDSFIALPTDTLDTKYYVGAYSSTFVGANGSTINNAGAGSQLVIVATQDATTVTVKLPPGVASIGSCVANTNCTLPTLNTGQTYLLRQTQTGGDLQGTFISANKPVAVFSGNRTANVPVGVTSGDVLIEQLAPTSRWGRRFLTMPFAGRINGDRFRIQAGAQAAVVTVSPTGGTPFTLNVAAGSFVEYPTVTGTVGTLGYSKGEGRPLEITSDTPIQVMQYMQSSWADDAGATGNSDSLINTDPSMMLVVPYEQYLTAYTLGTPEGPGIGFTDFINVIIPTRYISELRLDGVAPVVPWVPINGSELSGAQLFVTSGTHTLTTTSTQIPFAAFSHGSSTLSISSYAHPAGMFGSPVANVDEITGLVLEGTATKYVGEETCATATALDSANVGVPGVRVDIISSLVGGVIASKPTDANGEVRVCFTSTEVGVDTLSGRIGTIDSNLPNPTITWLPRPLKATFTAQSRPYDGTSVAVLGSCTLEETIEPFKTQSLVPAGVTCAAPSNLGMFEDPNVGTGKTVTVSGVTLSGPKAAMFELTGVGTASADITPVPVTITIEAQDKSYDATNAAQIVSCSVAGAVNGETLGCTAGTGQFASPNAGTHQVTASVTLTGATAANYTAPASAVDPAATITAIPVTPSIVAQDKVYDRTTVAQITLNGTGVLAADAGQVTLTASAADFANGLVGNDKTVTATGIALGGPKAGNYTLATTTATDLANITPRPVTVSIIANNKVYDGTTAATLSGTPSVTGVLSGDTVTATASSATFGDKHVGTNKVVTATVSLAGADAANYMLNGPPPTDLADITPLALTASIVANDKVYNGTAQAGLVGAPALIGGISGDSLTLTVGSASFVDKHVGTNKTVTATLTLGGADAGNYTFSGTATDLANITPLSLTATIVANDKQYDATTAATLNGAVSLAGVIPGDVVTASAGAASFPDENVGTSKTVSAAVSLAGPDAGNYTLPPTATDLANITPKPLTASIVAEDKVYNGNAIATLTGTPGLSGVIAGDVVTVAAGSAAFSDKHVGTDKTVTASVTLGGADAANYTLAANATDLANITPKPITTSIVAEDKVYNGNTAATLTGTPSLAGVILGDVVTVSLGSASFNDKNVGTDKTVTANLTIGGADAGNYTITGTATDLANITPKPIGTSIIAEDKVYNGTTAATLTGSLSLSGVIIGDVVTVSAGSATFGDKHVGTNKTVTAPITLGGADAGNYSIAATATDLANITPKPLTASISAEDKVYDGNNVATLIGTPQLTGVVTGDVVNITSGSATFGDKHVGNGKTVTASLTLGGADAGNYSFAGSTTDLANITPKPLSASIVATDKQYDGNATASLAGTPGLSGVVTGDVVTVTVGSATFSNKQVGTGKTVTASLTLGGADAGNYNFSGSATDLADITPKPVSATIVANDKVYNGTTAAQLTGGVTLVGVIAGDDVSATAGAAEFSDKNVGDEKPVTAPLTIAGVDQNNYTIAATATDQADITPLALTAGITANDKVYDGTNAATLTGGANLTGVIAGDNVTATVGSATFADKNVGDEKTVTA